MSDDLLERVTKALREEGGKEPSPERSSLVRARVLAQNKRRSQLRPQGIWQWAAVVCLGFFVSTAMAHVIKVQLPRVIEALRDEPAAPRPKPAPKRAKPAQPRAAAPEPPAPQPEPATPQPLAPAPVIANAPATAPPQQPAPARKAPRPAKPAPRPAPKPAPKPAQANTETALAAVLPDDEPPPTPTAAPPEAVPTRPQVTESAELTLFRRAQSLHLAHDPKAIEAWDAYLRVAGTSPLAPEARYNRALGLVRAKRSAEARKALVPFAEGKYGEYRRAEARALLEKIGE